jgi:asparagine synthase (glutamine-hydrolysing)
MRNQLLRDADWSSMAHSVELRVPLVDAHLHQQVAQLESVPGKRDLGASVRPSLPHEVLHRPKTGFGVPMPSP